MESLKSNFKTELDTNYFSSCVNRGMELLGNRKEQMTNEGYEWPIDLKSCKWAIEQAICNRQSGSTMMSAVIAFVESKEKEAEFFNGII
jgi:hypothetical protein